MCIFSTLFMQGTKLTMHYCSSVLYHTALTDFFIRETKGTIHNKVMSIVLIASSRHLYARSIFFSISFFFLSSQSTVRMTKEKSEFVANLCRVPIMSTPLFRLLLLLYETCLQNNFQQDAC